MLTTEAWLPRELKLNQSQQMLTQQIANINRDEITWAEQSAGKPRDD